MGCVALVAGLALAGACSFNGVEPGAQDGSPTDDSATGSDASVATDGGPACANMLVSDRVDLATLGAVQPSLRLGNGDWTLEADGATATFVSDGSEPDIEHQGVLVTQQNGADILVIYVSTFEVQAQTTVRLVGVHPVAFVADDFALIAGTIDVSSDRGEREGAGSLLAGQCGGRQPGNGAEAGGTAGGGGGGGHGADGESGGSGNNGSEAGGGFGMARNTIDFPLGGCGGGNGGTGADAGVGGLGGGVVEVIARCQLTVTSTGEIDAGGAGGEQGASNDRGGGGGGSGGFIGLQSSRIRLNSGAFLAANGGGGAEGRNGESGSNGDDGDISLDGGGGGNGNDGGNGGDGGGFNAGPELGTNSAGGGGGGGGGVGYIVITSADLQDSATFSPTPDIE